MSRTTRTRLLTAALTTSALLVVSGCTSNTPAPVDAAPAVPPPPAGTLSQSTLSELTSTLASYPALTGPAIDTFGAAAVHAAYAQLAEHTLALSFLPDLQTPNSQRTAADFALVSRDFTPAAADAWTLTLGAALAGDPKALAAAQQVTAFDTLPAGHTLRAERPFSDFHVSPAATSVDATGAQPRLTLRLLAAVDLNTKSNGTAYRSTLTKNVTYTLVPPATPDGRWSIDGWKAQLTQDRPQPTAGTA